MIAVREVVRRRAQLFGHPALGPGRPRLVQTKLERNSDRDQEDVLRLARAGYIDCGVLKARYLEEVRPYLLNKHEWHDQALELWIEMITAPGSQLAQGSHVTRGPTKITRNGRKAVVVVSAEERERKTRRIGILAEFFARSPLRASGLKLKRSKDKLRSTDL